MSSSSGNDQRPRGKRVADKTPSRREQKRLEKEAVRKEEAASRAEALAESARARLAPRPVEPGGNRLPLSGLPRAAGQSLPRASAPAFPTQPLPPVDPAQPLPGQPRPLPGDALPSQPVTPPGPELAARVNPPAAAPHPVFPQAPEAAVPPVDQSTAAPLSALERIRQAQGLPPVGGAAPAAPPAPEAAPARPARTPGWRALRTDDTASALPAVTEATETVPVVPRVSVPEVDAPAREPLAESTAVALPAVEADAADEPAPVRLPRRERETPAEEISRPEPASMSRGLATMTSLWGLVGLAGLGALVAAVLGVGPDWVDGAGSVAVVTAMAWALASRTDGQRWLSALVALLLGGAAVATGNAVLSTGAAVMTCVVGGVFAVMATVPAVTYGAAAREALYATLLAGVVGLAAIGFRPTAPLESFEITTLLLAITLSLAIVYRLGAGLHGLGKRGMVVVTSGIVLLGGAIVYAELLGRYGAPGTVRSILDFVEWSQDRAMAFPRPIVVVLGVPALAWGAHLRARRRQGWWVTAFGVAATVPVATSLIGVDASLAGAGLRATYSLVAGLLVAWVVIRLDQRLTGPKGAGARRAEEAGPHRPEPSRFAPL